MLPRWRLRTVRLRFVLVIRQAISIYCVWSYCSFFFSVVVLGHHCNFTRRLRAAFQCTSPRHLMYLAAFSDKHNGRNGCSVCKISAARLWRTGQGLLEGRNTRIRTTDILPLLFQSHLCGFCSRSQASHTPPQTITVIRRTVVVVVVVMAFSAGGRDLSSADLCPLLCCCTHSSLHPQIYACVRACACVCVCVRRKSVTWIHAMGQSN